MKKLLLVTILLMVSGPAFAIPKEVLIFPSGAIITEETQLKVQAENQAELTLPMAADPDSLVISTAKGDPKIINLQVDSKLINQSGYQELESRLQKTKLELQQVIDNLEIKKLALGYWNTQHTQKLENIEDIQALGKSILTEAGPLKAQVSQLDREKTLLDRQIREMERQLQEKTGNQNRVWKVSVTLDRFSQTVNATYSYRVQGANWQSLYALNALPQKNAVEWSWRADIAQSTGVDWVDVKLLLATKEPRTTLTPPPIGRWLIREQHVYPSARQKSFGDKAVLMETMVMADSVTAAPEEEKPKRKEGYVFDVYHLGNHTVKAGQSVLLDINSGSWRAEFTYLTRPIFSPQVFLMGNIELESFVPMPSGNASLLVDDVFIGKRNFGLSEKKFDLAFGSDPSIAVKVHSEQVADESGVFSKSRSQQWLWTVNLTNNKSDPISLKIEDAKPQVQDKRIEIEFIPAPPKMENDRNVWTLDLAAGATRELQYGFRVMYPADMQVDLGR